MKSQAWVVHKFGGTSVANADRYRAVARILSSEPGENKAVVVSAMSKVTDSLIELVECAKSRDDSYLEKLNALKERHRTTITELIGDGEARHTLLESLESDFGDIVEILRAVWLMKTSQDRTVELVSGFGELWSAKILNAYLRSTGCPSTWLDARTVLTVKPKEHTVAVDWKMSQSKVDDWLKTCSASIVVITGFIASTPEGVATTLKRNGSDFSASIFGDLLKASAITIWTDVDGVLSADPRFVPDAVVLNDLSYQEATELAYFGAKVVHPDTMAPAIKKGIPIWIRNTFNPTYPGTKIHQTSHSEHPVKGFATIEGMALVNLEGTGMIGIPGMAQRLFGSLKDVGVSVVMISQGSSEQSICFAVSQAQAKLAKTTVEEAFFAEIYQEQIQAATVTDDCAIIAAVGDQMIDHPGVAASFFTALAKAGVNIRAIAQGSSERNISAVIPLRDAKRALRAVHSHFYLSNQTLSIGILGTGLIGSTLINQLNTQIESLKSKRKIDLRVRALMDTKKMLLDENQVSLTDWRSDMAKDGLKADLDQFVKHVHPGYLPHAVIIDATSSAEIPKHYPEWLKQGISIITPNKKGNTASIAFYRQLFETARTTNKYYLYETTVGAGLPILRTLRDLLETGDQVQKIEGVFSGTLSYIFNTFSEQSPFSKVVLEAKRLGYTEPDPRDDLSGMDVARKLIILAREMGLELEVSDVQVESLVPEALKSLPLDQYMTRLAEFDEPMMKRLKQAHDAGHVLRYVGSIEPGHRPVVSLLSIPKDHPFARITGSDNIVLFKTLRYQNTPLVIQGPGAGPEVTAGGVFASILRLASFFGAPQ
jgi:aspartokinase/homoserine dehydrogenase 1